MCCEQTFTFAVVGLFAQMAAGYSVSVTMATTPIRTLSRFRSTTECLDFLGSDAYRPPPTVEGTIKQIYQHVIGNESVPKILVSNTISLFFKLQSEFL